MQQPSFRVLKEYCLRVLKVVTVILFKGFAAVDFKT